MKSILISIKPKWVAKILNGEKTIEIRKSMPKCDLPIDVYIYCSKDKSVLRGVSAYAHLPHPRMDGKPTIRFNKDFPVLNGKVVAKFTLNKVEEIRFDDKEVQRKACLTEDELFDYLFVNEPYHEDMKKGYAWHIDDLVIFDEPKELSEFIQSKRKNYEEPAVQKAPKSWCYVEVEKYEKED